MGKQGTGLQGEIVRILTESKTALRSHAIAAQVHTTTRIVCATLCNVKRMGVAGLEQREIDGVVWYAIGKGKLPKEKKVKKEKFVLIMPADGFRGWFNPATGITGSKLGV